MFNSRMINLLPFLFQHGSFGFEPGGPTSELIVIIIIFFLTINSFLSLWSLFSGFNLMVYLKVHQQKFKPKLSAAKPIFVRYRVSYSCDIDSYLPVVTQSSHNSSLNCHVDFVLKSICGVSLPLALLMCYKHKHKLGH